MCNVVTCRTLPVRSGVPWYGTPAKKPFCTNVPAPSTPAVLVKPSRSDLRVNGPLLLSSLSSAETDISSSVSVRGAQVCSAIRPLLDRSQAEPVDDDSLKTGAGRSATATLARLRDRATLMVTIPHSGSTTAVELVRSHERTSQRCPNGDCPRGFIAIDMAVLGGIVHPFDSLPASSCHSAAAVFCDPGSSVLEPSWRTQRCGVSL